MFPLPDGPSFCAGVFCAFGKVLRLAPFMQLVVAVTANGFLGERERRERGEEQE